MSDLTEVLKQQVAGFGGVPLGVDRAVYLTVRQWQAVIADRERAERLEKALADLIEMIDHLSVWQPDGPAHIVDSIALTDARAALESE